MYYMAYFRDKVPELYLAESTDLLTWTDRNNGKAVLSTAQRGKIIRDPYLLRDGEGTWHVFYTNDWYSRSIGHAVSVDLEHFAEQEDIELFPGNEDVFNCWAPECFYDTITNNYYLIWSSSFRSGNGVHEDSNRIWCARSRDLYHFEEPELYFDPGYPVIDSSVVEKEGKYYMAFKDERDFNKPGTVYSAIRTAVAEGADGPYTQISPILTGWRTEGPMLLHEKGCFYIFYDSFGDGTYKGMRSKDFVNWEDITQQMVFPAGCRHLSIVSGGEG